MSETNTEEKTINETTAAPEAEAAPEAAPEAPKSEQPKRKPGRPKAADSAVKPKRKPGPRPGSQNRKKIGPPEVSVRKAPDEISDPHAAMRRVLEKERELHEYKRGLAERYKEQFGTAPPVGPEPRHMLEGPTVGAVHSLSLAQARSIVRSGAVLPGLAGLESRPTEEAKEELSQAIHELSKHYPDLGGKMIDWSLVIAATGQLYGPCVVEFKAKKAGTWSAVRPKFVDAGLIPEGGKRD